jgi:SAM-dependent methyltransferase
MKKSRGSNKYKSETEKVMPRLLYWLHDKTKILDIGCGQDKVTKDAVGIDERIFSHTNFITKSLYDLPKLLSHPKDDFDWRKDGYEVVYSSHVLEHLPDTERAISEWSSMVRLGGHFILYLPDDNYYDNDWNHLHLKRWTFLEFFKKHGKIPGFDLVQFVQDVDLPDKYSFLFIWERLN